MFGKKREGGKEQFVDKTLGVLWWLVKGGEMEGWRDAVPFIVLHPPSLTHFQSWVLRV